MHLGDGRGETLHLIKKLLKDKSDGVVHGALLLGLVSGLVASRLPGLVRERKKLTHVSLLKQVQALSWQESRSAKTLDLYLKMISVYIHMISRLASHDLVQLVLVLL